MADKLTNINTALSLVGAGRLSSLTENTVTRKKAVPLYEVARLEAFDLPVDWYFATAWKQVAQRTETPIVNYSFMYNLPNGLRRIQAHINVNDETVEYGFKRGVYINDSNKQFDVMFSNQNTPAYIRYTVDRPNEGVYPAWFNRLIYLNHASMLAEPLKKDKAKATDMTRAYELAKNEAEAANAIEVGKVSDKNVRLFKGNTDVVDAAFGVDSTINDIQIRTELIS